MAETRINIVVYVLLLILTILSVTMTDSQFFTTLSSRELTESILIVLAGLKIALIAEYFIELHKAPGWLRGMMLSWIALLVIMLNGVLFFFRG